MSASRLDRLRAYSSIRRAADAMPMHLTERVAGAARGLSGERLERLMRAPILRRVILDFIFRQMPRYLDRTRARAMTISIRWRVTGRPGGGADIYQLDFANGRCRSTRRPTDDPHLTITVGAAELIRMATGASNPLQAYFNGNVRVSGDIMTAAKLTSLFVIPGVVQRQ